MDISQKAADRAHIVVARVEEQTPRAYRLGRRNGELVLQGAFFWAQGWNASGHEWRDIPTLELDEEAQHATARKDQP